MSEHMEEKLKEELGKIFTNVEIKRPENQAGFYIHTGLGGTMIYKLDIDENPSYSDIKAIALQGIIQSWFRQPSSDNLNIAQCPTCLSIVDEDLVNPPTTPTTEHKNYKR
jgi:hypothetical protein